MFKINTYPRRWVEFYPPPNFLKQIMKIAFFVDGFNLYHAIDKNFKANKYKWLNLRLLAENIKKPEEKIKNILYFSAYCSWNKEKKDKHKLYVRALSSVGVRLIKGSFCNVEKSFTKTKNEVVSSDKIFDELPNNLVFKTYEEKKTDVNIAVSLIEEAISENYDVFYILSADSDFAPALKYIKKHHRKIKLVSVLPPKSSGYKIKQVCDNQIYLTEDLLKKSLFNNEIKIGESILEKPLNW